MKTIILTSEMFQAIRRAFSEKYSLLGRQDYFGQATQEEISKFQYIETGQAYRYSVTSEADSDIAIIKLFQGDKHCEIVRDTEGFQNIINAHGLLNIAHRYPCPVTSKKLVAFSTFYLGSKMIEEIENIVNELSNKSVENQKIFSLYYREFGGNYRVLVNGKVHPLLCGLETPELARAKAKQIFGDEFIDFDDNI